MRCHPGRGVTSNPDKLRHFEIVDERGAEEYTKLACSFFYLSMK